jgi:hypothetical protein
MADFEQDDLGIPVEAGQLRPFSSHDHLGIKRFQNPEIAPGEREHRKSPRVQLRSAVEKIIQQNRDKGSSRDGLPRARFRSVVEEVIRQKHNYTYEPIDKDNEIGILRLHRGKKKML